MALVDISDLDSRFTDQRHTFLEAARDRYPAAPQKLDVVLQTPPEPVRPIVVGDLANIAPDELEEISAEYHNGFGVIGVIPQSFTPPKPGERHPLLLFADQLSQGVPLGFPVEHPMESHPEARARFGTPDGTLKLYNLPLPPNANKYREQAETNELFAAHNDGLGYAGLIYNSILVLDRPPMSGGYTYFQNLVRLAPALAADDPDAFQALFLPDAITALRPRGKGAIKVRSPVFFLGRDKNPQIFFRMSSGEYQITWREHPALDRARRFLERVCQPFAPSSKFVHFMRSGDTVVINNRQIVHGRTGFIDPPNGQGRVLARKWFVPSVADMHYRHVPGVEIAREWAELYPEHFTGEYIEGEWHYEPDTGKNVKVSSA